MIRQKDNEIKKLKIALKAFVSDDEGVQSPSGYLEDTSTDSDGMMTDDSSSEDDEENGIDTRPMPIVVSDTDGVVYFCTACTHEVVDGECTGIYCGLKHQWEEVSPRDFPSLRVKLNVCTFPGHGRRVS